LGDFEFGPVGQDTYQRSLFCDRAALPAPFLRLLALYPDIVCNVKGTGLPNLGNVLLQICCRNRDTYWTERTFEATRDAGPFLDSIMRSDQTRHGQTDDPRTLPLSSGSKICASKQKARNRVLSLINCQLDPTPTDRLPYRIL
jgi:hypothetical protein